MTICIQIEEDLLHPIQANEKKKHKLKRLVQCPNSFFMDVKCPGCFNMLVPSQFLSLLLVSAAMFPPCGNLSTTCMYYFEHIYLCISNIPFQSLSAPPSSAMLSRLFCAEIATLCCASPLVVRLALPRVAHSGGRSSKHGLSYLGGY